MMLLPTKKKKIVDDSEGPAQKKIIIDSSRKKNSVDSQEPPQEIKKNTSFDGLDFPYGYGEAKQIPVGNNKKLWKMWIRWITSDVAKSFRSKSWINGMAFASMMSKVSNEIDMNEMKNMSPLDRMTKALNIAERVVGAEPGFILPEDLVACKKVTREIDMTIQLYLGEIQFKIDRLLEARG